MELLDLVLCSHGAVLDHSEGVGRLEVDLADAELDHGFLVGREFGSG